MRVQLTLILLSVLVALCCSQRAPEQYHIQTDQGPGRFFRFQTESGQYRKEEIHKDGSVTGSFGWVDPNGVLRLTDYISDAGGYRIERERLFKVGNSAVNRGSPALPADCQTSPELCFEIYPLDLNSDPTIGGRGAAAPTGSSGPRQLHIVEGGFEQTNPYLVSSLTSNQDLANPISKQNGATFYESELPLPAPPPEPKKAVIGAAANEPFPEQRSKPFVIGAAGSDSRFESRPNPSSPPRGDDNAVVIGVVRGTPNAAAPSSKFELHPNFRSLSSSASERSGVVIGLRNDRRRK